MKVRVGVGLGTASVPDAAGFGHVVDELERLAFDSIWFSERIGAPIPDPLVAMAFTAGRTRRLKIGTSVMVLPGRNPVVLAKELASLAVLSGGRLLPAFGLGVTDPMEQQAFGVERSERAAWFEESLAVMRQCWSGRPVVHAGERYRYDGVQVLPAPARLDVWLGGDSPAMLRRVGRLADGWLPSFVTPAQAADGRRAIEAAAAEHGREIDADHYGVLIRFALDRLPDTVAATIARRRPGADPDELVPVGWAALVATIERFVAVGTTKFVLFLAESPTDPASWTEHLEQLASVVKPLET